MVFSYHTKLTCIQLLGKINDSQKSGYFQPPTQKAGQGMRKINWKRGCPKNIPDLKLPLLVAATTIRRCMLKAVPEKQPAISTLCFLMENGIRSKKK